MILLDTCAWWWSLSEPQRLSKKAVHVIEHVARDEIFVSAISLWEFCMMCERGRIALTIPALEWMEKAISLGTTVLPITAAIAFESCSLTGFHGDPADRMIVSTARCHGLTVVTSDRKIREYAPVETVW